MPTPQEITALDAEFFNKPAQVARVLVPAGQTVMLGAYGVSYHLVSSTGNRTLYIATDSTAEIPISPGTAQEFPRYFRFKGLQIRNPEAFDVVAVVWYGFGTYTPHSYFLTETPTQLVGQNLAGGTIAGGGGTVVLPGTPSGNRISRKAVLVSNGDPSNLLRLLDGAGNEVGLVFPFTAFQLETSAAVTVKNDNGAAVRASVSEIWYAQQ